MDDTTKFYKARYKELCAVRDAKNAEVEALRKELDAANQEAQAAKAKADAIALKISEARGGAAWVKLKKEIGILARAVSGA